jgi:hypothetical protein
MLLILFPGQTAAAQSDQTIRQRSFKHYGFIASGFSREQEEIIQTTLVAFDQALGGHGRLARIMRTYNHGENWTITYVPDWTGADSSMKLSPTVFSIEKAQASNYSVYGASDEAMHAQIVIGHEIGHLLLRAVRDRTGVKWAKTYQQRITRDWERIKDPKAPEEEAVTELSLKVLKTGYFISINADIPETDPEIVAAIDGWSVDFLEVLQKLD